MATIFYPAIIERGDDGFGVYFPDLPGCVSAGRTVQEAALNAEEALNGHLAVAGDFGDAVADPSDIDSIRPEEGSQEVARLLVRAERPGKAVRVQITLEEGLLARIDRKAANRSGFLAEAARAKLAALADA
jgi:predicted RNase H-like HicB family nuclease